MKEITVIFGAGYFYKQISKLLINTNQYFLVDNDSRLWGENLDGLIVNNPQNIEKLNIKYVVITVQNIEIYKQIYKQIQSIDCTVRIVDYRKLLSDLYCDLIELKNDKLNFRQEIESMNIIFDSYWGGLGLGGVEDWTKYVVGQLITEGLNHTYIISKDGKYVIPDIMKDNILFVEDKYVSLQKQLIFCLADLIYHKLPCKVVVSFPNEVLIAASIVKTKYPDSISIIAVDHNDIDDFLYRYASFKEDIECVVGISYEVTEKLMQHFETNKVVLMKLPIKWEKNIERNYNCNRNDAIRIGYAGRIEIEQKRFDYMYKIIEILELKKVNYIIEIAGEGKESTELEAFIKQKKLENRVRYLGRLEKNQMLDFWKKQDIFLQFSEYEGNSISKLEAMGMGCVPIVTRTSGIKNVIYNNINGYIVEVGEYEKICEKIEFIEKNRGILCELGQKAHEAVKDYGNQASHLLFWKEILK